MIIAEHCKPERPGGDKHSPVCPWPDDCYVQWGGDGIVFTGGGGIEKGINILTGVLAGQKESAGEAMELLKNSYVTAFFEAFPTEPKTFIRGEGSTIEEAEKQAFEQFQKHVSCPGHEFERRGYTNGCGLCKHCGLFKSKAFEPINERGHETERPRH